MTVNARNSTIMAPIFIVLGLMMLIFGNYLYPFSKSYWAGVIIASVLMILFFYHSYTIGTRKLTKKEKHNAHKTAMSQKDIWIWGGIGCAIYVFGGYYFDLPIQLEPPLFGGFSALLILMGTAMLPDKFWLKAIFMLNISDPEIRKLWGGK